jgi:hypothetical protein
MLKSHGIMFKELLNKKRWFNHLFIC